MHNRCVFLFQLVIFKFRAVGFFFWCVCVCVVFVLRCTVMLLEVVLLYDLMLLVLLCLSAEVNCLACLMFIRRIMRIMITGDCMATLIPSAKGGGSPMTHTSRLLLNDLLIYWTLLG